MDTKNESKIEKIATLFLTFLTKVNPIIIIVASAVVGILVKTYILVG